jgi:hypothetical protein
LKSQPPWIDWAMNQEHEMSPIICFISLVWQLTDSTCIHNSFNPCPGSAWCT